MPACWPTNIVVSVGFMDFLFRIIRGNRMRTPIPIYIYENPPVSDMGDSPLDLWGNSSPSSCINCLFSVTVAAAATIAVNNHFASSRGGPPPSLPLPTKMNRSLLASRIKSYIITYFKNKNHKKIK